jgi:hypothetical protein
VPHEAAAGARLHYALLVLAAGLVLAGAWYWNVVPWKA